MIADRTTEQVTKRDHLDELIVASRSLTAHALELTKTPKDKPYDLEIVSTLGAIIETHLKAIKTLNNV